MKRDAGSAAVEFVLLAVVLFVPLVYVLLCGFALQRAVFAVTSAAREAGRAYVTGPDSAAAERAQTAADLALADQLPGTPTADLRIETVADGVAVDVRYVVELPLAGRWGRIPVTGRHVATPDRYRVGAGERRR